MRNDRWNRSARHLGAKLGLIALLIAIPRAAAWAEEPLLVGIKESAPFSMRNADGEWIGVGVDLWEEIAEDLELDFVYREAPLRSLLSDLEKGALDVVVSPLTTTAERERRFDFSQPYFRTGLGIAVSAEESILLDAIRNFFSRGFWRPVAVLISTVFLAGALVWLFERKRNPEEFGGTAYHGLGHAFWWSAVTMTTVGYGDRTPRTVGGRVVALVWMFASVIMISGITAAIASSLTVGYLLDEIRSPNDLQGHIIATVDGSISETYLKEQGVQIVVRPDIGAAVEAVLEGAARAVVYDAPILRYLAQTKFKGRVEIIPSAFDHQNYAFGLSPGSDLRESINRALLKQIHSHAWARIVTGYLGDSR